MKAKLIATRKANRRTRRFFYMGTEKVYRNGDGVEFIRFTAHRRFLIPSSKYMPHQGQQECNRRIHP